MSNSLRVCEERGEKVLLHKCTSMRPRLKIKLSHIPLLQSVKISTWPSELLNWTETLHLLETHRQSRIYTHSLDFSLFVISGFSNTYPFTALKGTVYPKINIVIISSPSCHSNQIWISFFCVQQSINNDVVAVLISKRSMSQTLNINKCKWDLRATVEGRIVSK